MKVAREPAMALVEKERVRLQITMQVEDFSVAGVEINVLKNEGQSLRASFGCGWHDLDEFIRALNNS
jgi:hypothetical protein